MISLYYRVKVQLKPQSDSDKAPLKVCHYVSKSLVEIARDVAIRFGDSARVIECVCVQEVNDLNS